MNLAQKVTLGLTGIAALAVLPSDKDADRTAFEQFFYGRGYAAEAAPVPEGFPNSMKLPDLKKYTERTDKQRTSDLIPEIMGEETTIKLFINDKYFLWINQLPRGEIYSFTLVDKFSGIRVFYLEDTTNKGTYRVSSQKFSFDPKAYKY